MSHDLDIGSIHRLLATLFPIVLTFLTFVLNFNSGKMFFKTISLFSKKFKTKWIRTQYSGANFRDVVAPKIAFIISTFSLTILTPEIRTIC